ncbi:hypothetical protein Poli38472_014899 [Pythium oligandrum]|uniref:Uncharacterized protein n=1 Tax=Pythium oligandrum TaxID=41045 RepID=A0A8K1C6T6_PYTOL|nr:hypothetical protein Poli38472_014899 [Pythium oligandrum]|eukprot:TMW57666.1 hypothetical protein Poli38472_014899 [Pythium oligandrum]
MTLTREAMLQILLISQLASNHTPTNQLRHPYHLPSYKMKYTALLCAAVATLAAAVSAEPTIDNPSNNKDIISPTEALDAIKEANLPAGMKLTGTLDSIQPPANTNASKETTNTDIDTHIEDSGSVESKQEWLGYGGRGWGGWGGWVVGWLWSMPLRVVMRWIGRMGLPSRLLEHIRSWLGEPFIGEWLGNPPRVFITTPEAVEEVTKAKFNNFPKGETQLDKLRDVLGGGIFASDHAQWANQHKTAANLFTV